MSAADLAPELLRFPLRPGRGAVALHATGFRHPRSRWGSETFTAYAELTHLSLGARVLRIGTRQSVFLLPRAGFAERDGPEALVRALVERVVREPGGTVQLARMAEIEELARQPASLRATWAIVAACAGALGLELALGPIVHHAGFMSPLLAASGEPWRLVTANLLHAGPVHFALNALALLALGAMVERPLGTARTVFVMGLSGIASTATAWLAGYDALVGASGIVAGLAGAALWLELRRPERLPAGWRIPRRVFLAALLIDGLAPLALPFIAGAAHLGGFAAGMGAAALASGPQLRREPLRPALGAASALVVAVALASLASAGRLMLGSVAWEGHAERLLGADRTPPLLLNDAAWIIATAHAPSQRALAEAVELAERAVGETDRRDPNVLDTLAEAQFRAGDADSALVTIDEAIELAPDEAYFREQRRRFAGDRAAEDRPAPPSDSAPRDPSPAEPFFEEEPAPGIAI